MTDGRYRETYEFPTPFMSPLPSKDTNQTILTLGVEVEFMLIGFQSHEDPHSLVAEALERQSTISFGDATPTPYYTALPEVRSCIRREVVPWVPAGMMYGPKSGVRRYDRRRFNVMSEQGIDPEGSGVMFGDTWFQERPQREDTGAVVDDDEVPCGDFGTQAEGPVGDIPTPVQRGVQHGGVADVPESAATHTGGSHRASLEISTPVLRLGSWQRATSNILDSLMSLQNRVYGSPLKVRFNQYTGLHVHVARRGGWSIHQAKKILKAIVIFEEAMDLQHPHSRRSESHSVYPQSSMFRSNVRSMRIHSYPKMERVKWVDFQITQHNSRTRHEGLKTLCDLTNANGKGTKYNFLGVLTSGTVEFRQAIASLDKASVERWVKMVLDFVSAAIYSSKKDLLRWAITEDEHGATLPHFLHMGQKARASGWLGSGPEDEFESIDNWDIFEGLGGHGSDQDEYSDFSVEEFLPNDVQQAPAA